MPKSGRKVKPLDCPRGFTYLASLPRLEPGSYGFTGGKHSGNVQSVFTKFNKDWEIDIWLVLVVCHRPI